MSNAIFRLADVGILERKLENNLVVLTEIKEDEEDERLLQSIGTELNDLKKLPTITIHSLQTTAHWVVTDEERDCACCSYCKWYIDRPNASFAIPRYKYCPNCGARMEEVK